jgi:hypothetical protein
MTWKSYVLASGGVIATYLASVPVRPVEDVPAPRRVATRPSAAADIQEQAVRLQARTRQRSPYREPSRNPFRFSARSAPSRAVVEAPWAVAPSPVVVTTPVPVPPVISLSGVAADEVGGAIQRTAILSTPGGVLLVREGDAVGAEYTVGKIFENAVDLIATDGSVRRVSFRP